MGNWGLIGLGKMGFTWESLPDSQDTSCRLRLNKRRDSKLDERRDRWGHQFDCDLVTNLLPLCHLDHGSLRRPGTDDRETRALMEREETLR